MLDVICIGSAVQDVFFVSEQFKKIKTSAFPNGEGECVALGSKTEVDELHFSTGGAATNCSATLASLKLKVGVISRIGNDGPGKEILADLKSRGINTALVRVVKKGQTGFGAQLTMLDGERSILVYRGVSAGFKNTDIPLAKLNTKWVFMSSLAGNTALVKRVANYANKQGISVGYNPGSKELEQGMDTFEPILKNLTYLSLNLEEARMLAGSNTTPKSLLNLIHRPGMTLAITDGGNGTYVKSDNSMFHVGTREVPVVSRTGAGDAFNSGTMAALISGYSAEDALRIGTMNAEGVIGEHGAKNGILKRFPTKRVMQTVPITPIK